MQNRKSFRLFEFLEKLNIQGLLESKEVKDEVERNTRLLKELKDKSSLAEAEIKRFGEAL